MTQVTAWLEQHGIHAVTAVVTVVFVILASIIILLLSRGLRRWLTYVRGPLHLTYETILIIGRVITAVLWLITIFIVLSIWGANLGGVWAVLVSGITVIGVGFLATWALVSNFTAYFFLVMWRPFHFGQTVELLPENLKGRVTDRNLLFTTLREDNGSVIQIPNNLFFQKIFRVSGRAAVGAQDFPEYGDTSPNLQQADA